MTEKFKRDFLKVHYYLIPKQYFFLQKKLYVKSTKIGKWGVGVKPLWINLQFYFFIKNIKPQLKILVLIKIYAIVIFQTLVVTEFLCEFTIFQLIHTQFIVPGSFQEP